MDNLLTSAHDGCVQEPSPAAFLVKSNTNRCAAQSSQDRRTVAIGEIDHAVEAASPKLAQKSELRAGSPSIHHQHLVHVRVPFKDVLGPTVHDHREACVRKPVPEGAQYWRRQEHIPNIPELDDQNVAHIRVDREFLPDGIRAPNCYRSTSQDYSQPDLMAKTPYRQA